MDFSKFDELPDSLSEDTLEKYFNQIVDIYESAKDSISYIELSEAIYQLSERQWHTYKILDDKIKHKIDILIKNILDANSYDLIDNATSIIAYLGLPESFKALQEMIKENPSEEVRELIEETIEELEGNVENPYSGLE
ncbi:hypothetical protein MOE82_12565 [Bacillus licheniformis]|uniref:hypothetical protein n=1 Tax=Bacillus licheniformis TaxID=1402 RepID=UPI00018C8F02|nr:hypothetical protein [Bacillus licheniformis]KYC80296.1 hypothetical protein B4090_3633 [Bacillus licheniformis]MBK4207097.1 hypothetical protein [Bacillus licheniformis]MCA1181102.1 hypothetical protein [Bacillus licheniformis]MCY7741696.1 hypothetical protein [Bacillus licheniformis]MCY7774455.1 hypothetical protein [Bacillus licheniformis]